MCIAVLSALQVEIDLLVDALTEISSDEVAGWPIWTGTRSDRSIVVARAGLGKVNTAALATFIWSRYRPSLILFTGVAGGLDPALSVGDLVIGARTIHHDAGVVTPGGLDRYQAGHVPFFNPTDRLGYEPSATLLETATTLARDIELRPVLGRSPSIEIGTIATGDQFLHDPTSRDHLFATLGARAVEMEGAALAQVADRVGIDHLVVRSLSDLAGEDSIESFDEFFPEVAANSARFVLALIDRLEEHHRDHPCGF